LTNAVNTNLQEFCANNPNKARYHPFPFTFEGQGENWDTDEKAIEY